MRIRCNGFGKYLEFVGRVATTDRKNGPYQMQSE